VIAGDVSVGEPDSTENTVMDVLAKDQPAFLPESQKRQRSQAVSSDMGSNAPEDVEVKAPEAPEQRNMMSEKSRLRVVAEETKFREMGWDTLRDALRRFPDEGDVQMCSMLAVVAPQELRIEKHRVARFLESYVGSFDCSELLLKARDLTVDCQISSRISSCIHQLRMCGNIRRQKTFVQLLESVVFGF
jgi:hypothetical protein